MDSGNDYVIQVKRNQPRLFSRVKEIAQQDNPIDIHIDEERTRGRTTTRYTQIFNNSGGIDQDWINLKRIIKVVRSGERKAKQYKEDSYYISSKDSNDASYFAQGIRAHWGIENKLHWVKDTIMNEDNCRIKTKSIVGNLSLIRSCVISLFRIHKYPSITLAIEKFNNKISDCESLMCDIHIYDS